MWPFSKKAPAAPPAAARAAVSKLSIGVYETKKKELKGLLVNVQLNPSSYTMTEGSSFNKQSTVTGEKKQSGSDELRKLNMTLNINSFGSGNYGIKHKVFEITKLKGKSKIGEPYICKLSWSSLVFWCNLDSYTVAYTMFDRDGTPVRARVDLSFVEYIDDTEDPSAAGVGGNSENKTVGGGDRIDSVAGPSWKSVAKGNGIDNPRKLSPGTSLSLK